MQAPGSWNDRESDAVLGRVLQVGVLLSAAIVLVGGILFLMASGSGSPDFRHFHGEPAVYRSVDDILRGALRFGPRALVQLGLLVLIATPVARVAFSLVAFVRQRDGTYVAITALVLALLLLSLTGVI
jgi:uncharacterized membrane protein